MADPILEFKLTLLEVPKARGLCRDPKPNFPRRVITILVVGLAKNATYAVA